MAQVVKNLPANAGDADLIPRLKRSPGEGTCSNILAWEIPWTKEPGRLQSVGSQKSQTRLGDKATTAINKGKAGNSLVVEWLRLRFHCRGLGVDPWSGTKTSQLDGMA